MNGFWLGIQFGAVWLGLAMAASSCGKQPEVIQGPSGAQGANGQDGSNGKDGKDASPTTTVQLCPGVPTYPSTIIEFALCIEGNLYGVYSANGGFLAYFPPGAYTSNAIGSACNFTVSNGCVVTN